MAVPKKDGQVRICVDIHAANTAIKCVRHLIPIVADVSLELDDAQYFSKLDLSHAFRQLELHVDSRFITTFSAHLGLYCYKRLNFGANASAEKFQHTLQEQLKGINGIKNIAKDIIVYGKTRKEHNIALEACLKRLQESGFTLNKEKCNSLNTKSTFFGQAFSKEGTCPDPRRVQDVTDISVPKIVSEIHSFFGMANHSSKYINDFATIVAPLRDVTKQNVPFDWKKKHQEAFERLKIALTTPSVMARFDKNSDTFITVDASPVGISEIISQQANGQQEVRVISYANRALSDVERRYSQTEKEVISIV